MTSRILILSLFFLPEVAQARLLPENYEGTRPLGMGGAFLAISDDQNGVFYNPAGLDSEKSVHLNLLDVSLGIDSLDTLTRILRVINSSDTSELLRESLQTMRGDVKFTLKFPHFALSFFDYLYSLSEFRNVQTLEAYADVFTFNDLGVAAGAAFPFGPYVSAGVTVKGIQRTILDATLTTKEVLTQLGGLSGGNIASGMTDYMRTLVGVGVGVSLNAGVKVKVPIYAKGGPEWDLALVANDIGGTSFAAFPGTSAPQTIPASYHFGTAFRFRSGPKSEINLAFDYRHITANVPFLKKLHFGVELRRPVFDIQLGIYQVYPTFGLALKFPAHTRLMLMTYAAELGSAAPTRSQRIYQLQLVIGFNPT